MRSAFFWALRSADRSATSARCFRASKRRAFLDDRPCDGRGRIGAFCGALPAAALDGVATASAAPAAGFCAVVALPIADGAAGCAGFAAPAGAEAGFETTDVGGESSGFAAIAGAGFAPELAGAAVGGVAARVVADAAAGLAVLVVDVAGLAKISDAAADDIGVAARSAAAAGADWPASVVAGAGVGPGGVAAGFGDDSVDGIGLPGSSG